MAAVEMFFNEISLSPLAEGIHTARIRMAHFMQAIGGAIKNGCNPILRVHNEFAQAELTNGYHLYNWRNDSSVERDYRVLLTSLEVKRPHLTSAAEVRQCLGIEGSHLGTSALGLTAAYAFGGLAISFLTQPSHKQQYSTISVRFSEGFLLFSQERHLEFWA